MLINCRALVGEGFEFVEETHLRLSDGRIAEIQDGFVSDGVDLRSCLAVPGLINAHTHIGDSFAKEACTNLSVHEAVGREGKKWEIYRNASRDRVIKAMRDSATDMLYGGTSCFADFREGSKQGVEDLRIALKDIPIKAVCLGRDLEENGFEDSDGLGLNVYQLDQVPARNLRRGKIVALHAGEVEGELSKALEKDPDLIVHFTKGSAEEAQTAAEKNTSVVLCPRSNASLRVGFPPARMLLDEGVNVCLGTDNVMINSPDLWREMEFLYKFSQINGPLTAEEVFAMATVNGAKAFRLNKGLIAEGRDADIAFIDLDSVNLRDSIDLVASLVTRVRRDNVREVMVGGEFMIKKNINQ